MYVCVSVLDATRENVPDETRQRCNREYDDNAGRTNDQTNNAAGQTSRSCLQHQMFGIRLRVGSRNTLDPDVIKLFGLEIS